MEKNCKCTACLVLSKQANYDWLEEQIYEPITSYTKSSSSYAHDWGDDDDEYRKCWGYCG